MYKAATVFCVGVVCAIAGARCYQLVYVDPACQLAPCPVPPSTIPCLGPTVMVNVPVYTTQLANPGNVRTAVDYRCEVHWFTKDPDGACTIQHVCVNFAGGFVLDQTVECHGGVH